MIRLTEEWVRHYRNECEGVLGRKYWSRHHHLVGKKVDFGRKRMVLPGLEPGTFSTSRRRDNRYTIRPPCILCYSFPTHHATTLSQQFTMLSLACIPRQALQVNTLNKIANTQANNELGIQNTLPHQLQRSCPLSIFQRYIHTHTIHDDY